MATTSYFYHTDPAGTPLAMTDVGGSVVWRADYLPFGEENLISGTLENNYKFVGKEMDKETGLYYFGARYMEAMIGRFVSTDPIGAVDSKTGSVNNKALKNPQRINLYAYGLNNPYRYVDPDGKQSVVTEITERTTTFDPRPLEPAGQPVTIGTRVDVTRDSRPGAGDPFTTPNVTVRDDIRDPRFGPPGAYIDTGDPRGRDIHGGGTGLTDPYAPRQGWVRTYGCTRGQNEDVQRLGNAIREFQQRHPGVQIPYTRRD